MAVAPSGTVTLSRNRNLRLLEEIDRGMEGFGWPIGTMSYGLEDPDVDISKAPIAWGGLIQGPTNTVYDSRIFTLRIVSDITYPDSPPKVWFITRINLPSVDQQDGRVDPAKFPMLGQWKWDYTLETVLTELQKEMITNPKLPQPAEGTY